MKKIILSLLFFDVLLLAGCGATLKGTDALIAKAREEMPVSGAQSIEIQYAGLCSKDDKALIWFISGDAYQAHSYLPMECRITGEEEYKYKRVYKPMDFCADTAVLQWQGGYAFLVNNRDCATIRITDAAGTKDIQIENDAYPYIFFHEGKLSAFFFLDADGNELP